MKCVFLCVCVCVLLLFDDGSWNGCRMLCSALELKGKFWTNLRKVYVTFICDWSSLSFANQRQLLPNRRRWKNAQVDKRILPHIWRCKWCEMCEYWADFYLVCTLFTHTRGSLSSSHLKDPGKGKRAKWHNRWPSAHHHSSRTMLREHREPAGRGISSLPLSDQLNETQKPLRKSSLFYQSLLVASWELKDKAIVYLLQIRIAILTHYPSCGPAARKADAASIWSVLPSMLWLPHVWAVSWIARVPDGTAFSCTPNIHCFSLKLDSFS